MIPELEAAIEAAARNARLRRADEGTDRRLYRRLSGAELAWIRQVRLKNGPDLAVVDLSNGGALIDARVPMKPGARLTIELGAHRGLVDLPSEVLRCRVASLDGGVALYRGACMFTAPIAIHELLDFEGAESPAVRPAAAPTVEGNWHRILVRYRDGGIVKGFTVDFHPGRSHFSVWPAIGAPTSSRVLVPMTRLKAVAFLQDADERAAPIPGMERFLELSPGRTIEVTFIDREVLRGVTPSYRPNGAGFFLKPQAPPGTRCLFVARSAVRHVRFQ